MGVIKRNNKWWVDFCFNRVRYRKPSPENSRAGARAYEMVQRQRLARGEPVNGTETNNTLYKDFAADWFQTYVKNNNKHSEVISKEMILRVHLVPYFGRMNLETIDNLKTEKYKARKMEEGLNPKSINNHLTVLHKSLQCAMEWGAVKTVPVIKRLKLPPQKYDFLTEEECQRLIATADDIWREMIMTVLGTGLRYGELIALTWDSVDYGKRELTVSQAFAKGVLGSPKSNKARSIPMNDEVYGLLSGMKRDNDFVFWEIGRERSSQVASLKKLHRICNKAGLRKIGWHTLRHTFASHLAQRGASLVAVQHLLGHSDIRTTMRYAHIDNNTLREAIDMLAPKGMNENLRHNSVTSPVFSVKMDGVFKDKKGQISAKNNKKRAEALFS